MAQLERVLTQLTGLNISVSSISQHVQDGQLQSNLYVRVLFHGNIYFRTDIRIYAMDPTTGEPMNGDKLANYVAQVFTDVQRELAALQLLGVSQSPVVQATSRISTAEIILIAVAAVVIAAGK